MSSQLDRWAGSFGDDYTDRNPVDWRTRSDWFTHIIGPLNVETVLEVGCNRGHNIRALRDALPYYSAIDAVEPNALARGRAETRADTIHDATIYELPFPDGLYDLAFTCGVLIHVPPETLDRALAEMHRVTRRYLLAIEYDGNDEAVEYQGLTDMMWRRDIGRHYQRMFPDLVLLDTGDLTEADGFAASTYWLLEKP